MMSVRNGRKRFLEQSGLPVWYSTYRNRAINNTTKEAAAANRRGEEQNPPPPPLRRSITRPRSNRSCGEGIHTRGILIKTTVSNLRRRTEYGGNGDQEALPPPPPMERDSRRRALRRRTGRQSENTGRSGNGPV